MTALMPPACLALALLQGALDFASL